MKLLYVHMYLDYRCTWDPMKPGQTKAIYTSLNNDN